jgi:hypothetical protein
MSITLFAHNGHDHVKEAMQYADNNEIGVLAIGVVAAVAMTVSILVFMSIVRKRKAKS